MTPEIEERLKAIETQLALVVAQMQALGQQVGMILQRLNLNAGG